MNTWCNHRAALLAAALFSSSLAAATHEVAVNNNFFSPNDLTIQVGDTATLDIEITQGGVFDSPAPAPTQGPGGAIVAKFTGCNAGEVMYNIPSANALRQYATEQAALPSRPDLDALDLVVQNDPDRLEAIAAANESLPIELGDREVQDLLAFLHALTDPASLDMRADVPPSVPSGLPVWD